MWATPDCTMLDSMAIGTSAFLIVLTSVLLVRDSTSCVLPAHICVLVHTDSLPLSLFIHTSPVTSLILSVQFLPLLMPQLSYVDVSKMTTRD